MHLLIEAVGIRSFGGVTVLLDVLDAAHLSGRFDLITVLTSPSDLRTFELPELPGVRERSMALVDRSLVWRTGFYLVWFRHTSRRLGAQVVLSLTGMAWAPGIPTAVLIQQPVPFYPEACAAFGWGMRARFGVIRALMRRAARRAAVVLVQSTEMRRAVGERFGLGPSHFGVYPPSVPTVQGGPEDPRVASVMRSVPRDRRLLYVGSDAPHKNLGLLAEGIGLIRRALPGATLFATLPETHPLGHAEGVVCLGVLDRGQLATAYRLAGAVCQASWVETVGLPMLEAMAAGVPVLAADRPYAREMCGDAAGFFDPADPGAFAAAAVETLTDAHLTGRRRARGRAIMGARRDERPYRQMIEVLAGLAGQGTSPVGD